MKTPEHLMFPDEPVRMGADEADRLFVHAARSGASDITLQTDRPVFLEVHGVLYPVTRRALDNHELSAIINGIYGQNASAMIKQGIDLDPSHEVRVGRTERYRFRVNATACYAGFEDGMQITVRIIASQPPRLADLDIEPEIRDNCRPDNGLVVITGGTGNGKSTILAAVVRSFLEDADLSKKIITYEAPIEYVYDEIESLNSLVSQHEIPRNVKSFPHAVRNSLRRAPKIILVGESRDPETISAALEASETGHALYTTVHSNSVAETIYRMVNMFPQAERSTKMFEILESLRLVVTQRLVRTVDGKRTGLREFLVFTEAMRDRLRSARDLREVTEMITMMVREHGQSMARAASKALSRGLIDASVAARFESAGQLFEEVVQESRPRTTSASSVASASIAAPARDDGLSVDDESQIEEVTS